jgi:hypothetical protein
MIDLGNSLASETVGLIIGYSYFPSIAMKQVRREVELHFEKSEPTKSRGEHDIATEQSPSCIFLSPHFLLHATSVRLYTKVHVSRPDDRQKDVCAMSVL